MNKIQKEFNDEAVKLLNVLIREAEKGAVSIYELDVSNEIGKTLRPGPEGFWTEELVPTGFRKLYIRYKLVEDELE